MKNKPFIIHPSPTSPRDAEVLEQRRLKAAQLFKKGVHQADIARAFKVSRAAVHYWYITWQEDGKEGLRSNRPGPKPKLTREKVQKIKAVLLKGAHAAGYATELWTLARVAKEVKKSVRLSYGTTQIWYILRAMGWSSQKPETQYRNRNEAAIRRWKQETWPQIQKRG